MKSECKECKGKGVTYQTCEVSGARIGSQCKHCDATGFDKKIYYGIVLTHKSHGEQIWLHPTLFDTLGEAQRFQHREYIVVRTIEVKI